MKKIPKNYLLILKHYELIIAASLVIVMVIILTIKLLIPNFDKAQNIFFQQKQLRDKYSVLKIKDDELSTLEGSYYKDALNKFLQVIPNEKDYVSLFSTFDTLQIKTGATILRADFQLGAISTQSSTLKRDTNSEAFIVPISFVVSGNSQELNNFLNALTDLSGRLITIENASWGFEEDDLLQATLNGKAYFYPLPDKIASIDAPLPKLSDKTKEVISLISKMVVLEDKSVTDKIPVGKRNLFE